MYLIQYRKGYFVNAEEITSIRFIGKGVDFETTSSGSDPQCVSSEYADTFLRQIDVFNKSTSTKLLDTYYQ